MASLQRASHPLGLNLLTTETERGLMRPMAPKGLMMMKKSTTNRGKTIFEDFDKKRFSESYSLTLHQ